MLPPEENDFHHVLNRVVNKRVKDLGISNRILADRLGPHYRSFTFWLQGERKFPAELLPKLCSAIDDYELLDVLEHQVGRISYHIPKLTQLPNMEDVKAVQRLVKEVGEALRTLAETLEDGIVEKHELDRTIPELDDVIRECARLKHWLEARYRADHSPGRGTRH